jgi:hypothetical protein
MEESMQPDQPAFQEDNQSEMSPSPAMAQPEPPSTPEVAQLTPPPTVVKKKRSRLNWGILLFTLLILILVITSAGLGYWSYMLNSQLVETQQQLSTLQGEHDRLQLAFTTLSSANEKLTADLAQSQVDLEKAKTELVDAQKESKKWQTVIKDLDLKIDKASKLTEVLYAWSTVDEASDVLEINDLIKDSGDELLIKQWESLGMSPSDETFGKFMNYLVRAIRTSLQ